jgi:hypothetical protein
MGGANTTREIDINYNNNNMRCFDIRYRPGYICGWVMGWVPCEREKNKNAKKERKKIRSLFVRCTLSIEWRELDKQRGIQPHRKVQFSDFVVMRSTVKAKQVKSVPTILGGETRKSHT